MGQNPSPGGHHPQVVIFPGEILVSNAGFGLDSPAVETSEANWDRIVGVNLKGCFLSPRAVAREMVRVGGRSAPRTSHRPSLASSRPRRVTSSAKRYLSTAVTRPASSS